MFCYHNNYRYPIINQLYCWGYQNPLCICRSDNASRPVLRGFLWKPSTERKIYGYCRPIELDSRVSVKSTTWAPRARLRRPASRRAARRAVTGTVAVKCRAAPPLHRATARNWMNDWSSGVLGEWLAGRVAYSLRPPRRTHQNRSRYQLTVTTRKDNSVWWRKCAM